MTHTRSQRRRILAAAAIAGAALLASAGLARAQPSYEPYGYDRGYYGPHYDSHGRVTYDHDGDGYLDPRERAYQRADRDHDGRLDPRERRRLERILNRQARRGWNRGWERNQQHLSEHDLNRDGILDRREMRELRRHNRIEDVFYSYDRNGDRVLSYWEIDRTPLISYFRRADHDQDGHVTFEELDHYVEAPEQHQPRQRWGWSWSWGF